MYSTIENREIIMPKCGYNGSVYNTSNTMARTKRPTVTSFIDTCFNIIILTPLLQRSNQDYIDVEYLDI